MKVKGIILVVIGLIGIVFVCSFDKLAGKSVNDITGPRSISTLILCAGIIFFGIRLLLRSKKMK